MQICHKHVILSTRWSR